MQLFYFTMRKNHFLFEKSKPIMSTNNLLKKTPQKNLELKNSAQTDKKMRRVQMR